MSLNKQPIITQACATRYIDKQKLPDEINSKSKNKKKGQAPLPISLLFMLIN